MNIVLFGFKACGKSTIGRIVAKQLHKTFIDIDIVIEDLYFNPILGRTKKLTNAEIFHLHGEDFFRALERDAVRKLRLIKQGVIATGGGSVVDYYNYLELKKNGILVYLKTDSQTLKERLLSNKPLPAILDPADPEGSFEKLYEARIQVYERVADTVVDTQGMSIQAVAEQVCFSARA